MAFVALLAVMVATVIEFAFAIRSHDWRPLVAALTAGFIALLLGFFILVVFELEPSALVYMGAAGLCGSAIWRALHATSWLRAWDLVVRFVGDIHFVGTVVLVIASALAALLAGLRYLRGLF